MGLSLILTIQRKREVANDYRYFDSPIKSVSPLGEGKITLKLGIFPKIPDPEWESFAIRRQVWEKPLEGTVQYKTRSFGEKLERIEE
jgi:hypothetical protein